jgi:hypothetical protein
MFAAHFKCDVPRDAKQPDFEPMTFRQSREDALGAGECFLKCVARRLRIAQEVAKKATR